MAPRFDMTLFTTIDALIRNSAPQPLLQADAPYTAADPLSLYVPKSWLITQLNRTIRDMTANRKAAAAEGLLPQEALDEVQVEIDRRIRFVAALRADTSSDSVYMAMQPTSDVDDAPEDGPSWN